MNLADNIKTAQTKQKTFQKVLRKASEKENEVSVPVKGFRLPSNAIADIDKLRIAIANKEGKLPTESAAVAYAISFAVQNIN